MISGITSGQKTGGRRKKLLSGEQKLSTDLLPVDGGADF